MSVTDQRGNGSPPSTLRIGPPDFDADPQRIQRQSLLVIGQPVEVGVLTVWHHSVRVRTRAASSASSAIRRWRASRSAAAAVFRAASAVSSTSRGAIASSSVERGNRLRDAPPLAVDAGEQFVHDG